MDSLRKLEEIFAHFPGIGPRQARRFVYYLMGKSPTFIREFVRTIEEVRETTGECAECHRIFAQENTKKHICAICSDQHREQSILMVVARDSDLESIEKSGEYRGQYFVLGGNVPVLDKDPEKRIRLRALLDNISNKKDLKEIILSLNTTPDGEHTMRITKEAIENIVGNRDIRISLLGRGLSTGAELEYVDGETIRSALKNRN